MRISTLPQSRNYHFKQVSARLTQIPTLLRTFILATFANTLLVLQTHFYWFRKCNTIPVQHFLICGLNLKKNETKKLTFSSLNLTVLTFTRNREPLCKSGGELVSSFHHKFSMPGILAALFFVPFFSFPPFRCAQQSIAMT